MAFVVEQDKPRITTSTIATYGLSSCYFSLLDGSYDDNSISKSSAHLNHHPTWIEPNTYPPIKILIYFLKTLTQLLEIYYSSILLTGKNFHSIN